MGKLSFPWNHGGFWLEETARVTVLSAVFTSKCHTYPASRWTVIKMLLTTECEEHIKNISPDLIGCREQQHTDTPYFGTRLPDS